MFLDVDNVWSTAYDQLQADISNWRPPGSFAVHASALRQTYQAFLSGAHVVDGAGLVLEGLGGTDATKELIQAAGEYQVATGQFAGHLSPRAQAAWEAMQAKPANQAFRRDDPAGSHRRPHRRRHRRSPPLTRCSGAALAPRLMWST